jgi:hypothetical protein
MEEIPETPEETSADPAAGKLLELVSGAVYVPVPEPVSRRDRRAHAARWKRSIRPNGRARKLSNYGARV